MMVGKLLEGNRSNGKILKWVNGINVFIERFK